MKRKVEIKAVFFDLGNVLVKYDALKAARKFAREYRVPLTRLWKHFFNSEVERAYTRGELTSRKFFAHAKEVLNLPMGFETFRDIWNDIFWENQGMEPLLDQLAKKYPLYLISNTNRMHFDFIKDRYGHMLRHFKRTFPSHLVKIRKPDAGIYEKALRVARCRPEEAVFIDDAREFVRGARRVGMHALHFKSRSLLIRDLKKLGVQL